MVHLELAGISLLCINNTYFKTAATQGLQLCHWGNNLSLKLKLHVIEFNRDMEDMMPAIEQHFAQVLKPLVGKHI